MSRMREAIRSGWKRSKSVIFSPLEANMTGLPVIERDRQGGATAGVAVELGEHHAVVADAVEEHLRGGDRVLADHRVDDEEHLVGLHGVADVGGLLHQLGVDAEAAGGVDDDDVVDLALGLLDRRAGHRDRVADAVAGLGGEDGHADALAVDLELLDGVGALEVGGDQHRGLALLLEPQRELGRQRRLAGALEAGEHDDRRAGLGVAQPAGLAAEDRDELVVDDLDDLLGRVERPADLLAAGALLDGAPTNSFTTGRATSASSSAMRISRAVASMSASDSLPLPRRFLKVSASRSERVANTVGDPLGSRRWNRAR